MTPFWREKMREAFALEALKGRSKQYVSLIKRGAVRAHVLGRARAFDLRSVEDLCYQAALEIKAAGNFAPPSFQQNDRDDLTRFAGAPPRSFYVDLGERTVLPADVCWLEFGEMGALFSCGDIWSDSFRKMDTPDSGVLMLFVKSRYADDGTQGPTLVKGCMMRLVNGVAEVTEISEPMDGGDLTSVCKVLAGFATINSPAATREPIEPHRGLERMMRANSVRVPPDIVHTKVTLGRSRHPAHDATAPNHSPRAYHFCRSHVRFKGGRAEQVRAHWRGDPAFGIRLPTYNVLPSIAARPAS